MLGTFAEFEADLIRMGTGEGMAIAGAKSKLGGKRPKLSEKQKELCRVHATGHYSIGDLAKFFAVSRPTVCRTLSRLLLPLDSTAPQVPCSAKRIVPFNVESHTPKSTKKPSTIAWQLCIDNAFYVAFVQAMFISDSDPREKENPCSASSTDSP